MANRKEQIMQDINKVNLQSIIEQKNKEALNEEEEDEEDEDDESLDGLNIDKDEDIQQLLTELNDTAIQALKNEDNENSLECLKRGEQLLEAVTAEGKDVDRNLIIVILYNLACTYQRMSMLEDCASYLDGTIYNLEAKVTNFDDNESIIQLMLQSQQNMSQQSIDYSPQQQERQMSAFETSKKFNISAKLFKLRYMCKCHLQLCAVLSQLNKHQEALYHGQLASFFCQELIKNTLLLCRSYIQRLIQENNHQSKQLMHDLDSQSDTADFKRTSYYVEENEKLLNLLITNCEPILQEVVKQVNHFNTYNKIQRMVDKAGVIPEEMSIAMDCRLDGPLFNTQNLLKNTNTMVEANYKKLKNTYITQIKSQGVKQQQQKQQKKDEMVPEAAMAERQKVKLNESTYYNTRGRDGESNNYFSQLKANVKTILGVKEQDDWIFNLNIGNVMHLLPMSLEELNLHIDNSHELSRDAMLEKLILLSVSYFCVGTELRFLSANKDSKPSKNVYGEMPDPETHYTKADSEMWHAMALETCGTFLPSECPLVSHVILSYQKHHSPAMQVIPEDEPFVEELKVIRPLNEVKNDQVNYHQIIRAYNTHPKPIPLDQRRDSRVTSRNSSRPQTGGKQRHQPAINPQFFYTTQDTKLKKKRDLTGELDLLEPEDTQAQMMNTNVSNTSKLTFDTSPIKHINHPLKLLQAPNFNHLTKPPQPLTATALSSQHKINLTQQSSRPVTGGKSRKVMDLNQRLMQTMTSGMTKMVKGISQIGQQPSITTIKKNSSRMSSANSRKQISRQRTSTPGQVASPKESKKPKKILLTQRLLAETQNLGFTHTKKKSSGPTTQRPAQTPIAQQQILNLQNLIQQNTNGIQIKQQQQQQRQGVIMLGSNKGTTKAKLKLIKLK